MGVVFVEEWSQSPKEEQQRMVVVDGRVQARPLPEIQRTREARFVQEGECATQGYQQRRMDPLKL